MDAFKRFLSYIEIKTKITSLFAFLLSLAYLFYKKQPVNWELTSIFFVSMFLFDLTTTAINNYTDTKKNGLPLQFKRSTALLILLILFALSAFSGLYLAYRTDYVVLFVGALCILCGVLYSAGPVPISGQPWGEFLSGVFYGLFIPFIILYINMPKGTYLTLAADTQTVHIGLNILPLLTFGLLCISPIATTANIMLANNTCDVERDIRVKRHTLPYYIGKKALPLFAGLYYLTYLSMLAMVLLKMLSPLCLLALLTIIPVQKNINIFYKKQDKATTFITAIKNYVLIMAANTFVIFISGFID